ncbi:MAG: hypothetical protein ABJD68_01690 [Nakamurella sp.]
MIDVKIRGVIHGVRSFCRLGSGTRPASARAGQRTFLEHCIIGRVGPAAEPTPYTGTMHAVVGLTETLDLELHSAASGVGATLLCPELVDTALG